MKNKIEILIPTYNEEKNIKNTINELRKNGYKNITVLDGKSNDKTVKIARDLGCRVIIDKKTKMGFGYSLKRGIFLSKKKYCCIFDADGSFNPNDINLLIKNIQKGADFIFASRYLGGNKSDDDTFVTRLGNIFFTKLINILFNYNISDALFLFVLSETKKFKSLNLKENDFGICTEILIKAYRKYKCVEIFSKERKRRFGVSKVNKFSDGLKLFLNIFKNFLF